MSLNSFLLKNLTIEKLSALFVVVLFAFGVIKIGSAETSYYSGLMPLFIGFGVFLIMIGVGKDLKRILYLLALFIVAMIVETVNSKSGMVFGWYKFGGNLGYKLFDVPVVKGLMWMSLLYGSAMLSYIIARKAFWQWFWAAFFMLLLDVFMETVACKLDLWCWANGTLPPPQNFIAVFLFTFIAVVPFRYIKHEEESRFPAILFMVQLLFFVLLNMMLV